MKKNIDMFILVTERDDFQMLAKLLNDAFLPGANDFGITRENCPSNNAFIDWETLKSQLSENRELYKLCLNKKPVGLIAIERSKNEKGTFYIEKVAIHPDYRHKGLGRQMMDFATQRIVALGGKRVSLGLIDSHKVLKDWYKNQGYNETGAKIFDHLPFKVCFMEKCL